MITMLMMTKIHHRLAYRTLQGFTESLIALSSESYPVPTYSLICKRAQKLKLPKLSFKRPSVIAIDASGVKVY
ncbi:MAG: transposase [Chlamydiales bacterium]|nr:transposase [Chlamydiales bacterium]